MSAIEIPGLDIEERTPGRIASESASIPSSPLPRLPRPSRLSVVSTTRNWGASWSQVSRPAMRLARFSTSAWIALSSCSLT